MRCLAALAAAVLTVLPACGGGDEGRLTVFAAASLSEVFPKLAPRARFNFAGSDELVTQIREGADADVYASADPRHAKTLFEAGLIERPRILAANQVVLVVPRSNPAGIASLADVSRSGVKLVVGARGVPIGDYARNALSRSSWGRAALRNVVSEEQDVKGVLGKVALAEADAGFVYASDVEAAGDKVRAIYPAVANSVYAIAVVRETDRREEAEAFVARALGEKGQRELLSAGFLTTSLVGDPVP